MSDAAILIVRHGPAAPEHSESLRALARLRPELDVLELADCPNIEFARSLLLTQALSGPYTRFLWIDADVSFEPPDAVRLLDAARELGAVGADYPKRSGLGGVAGPVVSQHSEHVSEREWLGLGFFAALASTYAEIAGSLPTLTTPFGNVVPFFRSEISDGHWFPSDVTFFRRLTRAGFPVLCDDSVRLGHPRLPPRAHP